jgi:hypothetical protein
MPTDDTPGYPLTLRDSAVHGRGCYAAEPIPAGAFIIEYTGEWVPAEEAYRREADPARPGIYTFWTGDEGAVDGLHGGNAARFINHSCSPNCDYRIADRRILIYAARPIAAGEELFIDYSFSPEGERVPCRCGSPQCRGQINAASED